MSNSYTPVLTSRNSKMSSLRSLRLFKKVLIQSKLSNRSFTTSKVKSAPYASTLHESYYNDEQRLLIASCAKIIETEINPSVDEWEAKELLPAHEVLKKFGNAGMLGIEMSPENGGLGLDFKYLAGFLEELGTIRCGSVGMLLATHMVAMLPLASFGSDELKKEFLIPSIAGDYVAAIGASETAAGSDVSAIQTTAIRKGDDLVINGQKMWITSGLQSDWICLLCNTSGGNPYKNKSLICVPMNSKGITSTKINKIGYWSSDTAQIIFEDVRVPYKYLIGDEGSGFYYQMSQFQQDRLSVSLMALKAMDGVLSETIEYTQQRKAFGKPILDNQYVNFRLAELATEIESLRGLLYKTVGSLVAGNDVTRLSSMAKLKAGRLAREVGDSCLQFWGGMGYTRDVRVSRFFRDGRLVSIGGGPDEIMLEIITKSMKINSTKKK